MEQNMNATMPAMESSQQGSGSGFKIATVVASIIAICGIGFGVYGMMQSSNKDGQISDLKVQIQNSDGTVTTIETPKIETTTNDGTVVTITDSVVKDENTEDYIYVGEWGIKIKKPENLEYVDYRYHNDISDGDQQNSEWGDHQSIRFYGVAANADKVFVNEYLRQSSIKYCGLITLSRVPKGEYLSGAGTVVRQDGNYDFLVYYHQEDIYRCARDDDNVDDAVVNIELEGAALVNEMLSNSDNYSAI